MLHYVVMDYMATGEGSTKCILITNALPEHEDYEKANSHMNENGSFHFEMPKLKEGITSSTIALRQFANEFGTYYASGAQIISEEEFLQKYLKHVPSYLEKIIHDQHDPSKAAGNVYYASRLHMNYG